MKVQILCNEHPLLFRNVVIGRVKEGPKRRNVGPALHFMNSDFVTHNGSNRFLGVVKPILFTVPIKEAKAPHTYIHIYIYIYDYCETSSFHSYVT